MRRLTIISCVLLSGCAMNWGQRSELAWQTLNVIDTAQTAQALSGTKCREANPGLAAVNTPEEAIGVGMLFAWLHKKGTDWLEEHHASKSMMIFWHGAGILVKGYAVTSNAQKDC